MVKTNILIAYFSRAGKNYLNSEIKDLTVGNTEVVAKKIQEIAGGDMFHIRTVRPYPEDYIETTQVAKDELKKNARPELADMIGGVEAYDTVFVGYPNWWGTMPMAVATFLTGLNLAGKTIAPFCTHEGSGLGRSVDDIRKLCPRSTVRDGLAIRGSDAAEAHDEIVEWLQIIEMKR